ncbi:hypothetical protein TIFTF001_053072 [Ficus carica]|uniref:Disease resistance protein At4g27190-like leucine-rich repeats domain-containing protein n=1 Tax=Ficus carica TaxID=3494 RepID=A0AA88JEC0_FICCA|nr:hypothetical protein TIFTF001_053072 [Ficus carica]
MLNILVYACLLEDTRGEFGVDCVKMHDLIRDMALKITSERPRFLVEAGMGLKCVPDEENWKEDLAKVSLMQNAISDIPLSFESPRCATLSTLLLNSNRYLHSISDNSFRHMTGLGLLDLSETSIVNLPESISQLVNLTALLLRKCRQLMYVPSLAKLTALKRLAFGGSGIKQVPQGMENLVRLRYLEIDECHQLKIIPDGVLCELLNLQYLSLYQTRGATTRGEELVFLRKLERIYCVLHDLNGFNAYVRSLAEGGPAYYILQLGFTDGVHWCAVDKHGKVVFLINCDISESVAKGGDCQLLLPQDVESLVLISCRINVSSLCELTSFKNATNFKRCHITKCGELKHLFVYSSSIIRLLQRLEELDLEAVWDLQGLIRRDNLALSSPLPPGTFCSLKILRVCYCNTIKRLSIVTPLPNLEDIIVFRCEQLVEIVAMTFDNEEEKEDQEHVEAAGGRSHQAVGVVTLPKLWNLHLSKLPKLKSIPIIADNSLRQVRIWECPKLKKVPCLDKVPVPVSLQYVRIGEDLWESLEWDHPCAKDAIQSMRAKRR